MLLIDSNIFIYLHKAKLLNKLKDLEFCYCNHVNSEVSFLKELFPLNLIHCNNKLSTDQCIIFTCKKNNYTLLTADKALKQTADKNYIPIKTISQNSIKFR